VWDDDGLYFSGSFLRESCQFAFDVSWFIPSAMWNVNAFRFVLAFLVFDTGLQPILVRYILL